MAKVHVLDTSGELTLAVFHIVVPNTNNSVGTSWRAVLINSGIGGSTRLADGSGTGGTISAAEKTQIQAGEVYEVQERIQIPTGLSTAQANAFLDALHAAKTTEANAQIVGRLNLFGFTRT